VICNEFGASPRSGSARACIENSSTIRPFTSLKSPGPNFRSLSLPAVSQFVFPRCTAKRRAARLATQCPPDPSSGLPVLDCERISGGTHGLEVRNVAGAGQPYTGRTRASTLRAAVR
jgi:hypothetical protein